MRRVLDLGLVALVAVCLAVAACKEKKTTMDWSTAVNWTLETQLTRSLMEYSPARVPPPSVWVLLHAPGACPEADGLGPKEGMNEFDEREATKKLHEALNACVRRKQDALGPIPKLARTSVGTLSAQSLRYDFERKGFSIRCPSQLDYEKERVEGVFGLPPTSTVTPFRASVPSRDGTTSIVTAIEFLESERVCSSPLFFPMPEDAAKALKEKLSSRSGSDELKVEFAFRPETAKASGTYVIIPARLVAARVVTATGDAVLPSIDL